MFTNRLTSSVAVHSHMYVTKEAALSRDTVGRLYNTLLKLNLCCVSAENESKVSHADSNNIRFDYVFFGINKTGCGKQNKCKIRHKINYGFYTNVLDLTIVCTLKNEKKYNQGR